MRPVRMYGVVARLTLHLGRNFMREHVHLPTAMARRYAYKGDSLKPSTPPSLIDFKITSNCTVLLGLSLLDLHQ